MANEHNPRGGTHEQHVKAGEQSHKGAPQQGGGREGGQSERGGTHEQHVKAGEQSHKKS